MLKFIGRIIRKFYQTLRPYRQGFIFFDYKPDPRSRYGFGEPPHRKLYQIINTYRSVYIDVLKRFLQYTDFLAAIPLTQKTKTTAFWNNIWLPSLDSVSIYSMLAMNNPRIYLEVGSGNSTTFARQAIKDHNLQTKIISIDPCPRAEINLICDKIIREGLQETDLKIFKQLQSGDIMFMDGSHRAFMNSDVIAFFLDIFPFLPEGVIVGIHDIFIPYDYPPDWKDRFYSEQYLLATQLLAGRNFDIVFPSQFASQDKELKRILAPLWKKIKVNDPTGTSFWVRTV